MFDGAFPQRIEFFHIGPLLKAARTGNSTPPLAILEDVDLELSPPDEVVLLIFCFTSPASADGAAGGRLPPLGGSPWCKGPELGIGDLLLSHIR